MPKTFPKGRHVNEVIVVESIVGGGAYRRWSIKASFSATRVDNVVVVGAACRSTNASSWRSRGSRSGCRGSCSRSTPTWCPSSSSRTRSPSSTTTTRTWSPTTSRPGPARCPRPRTHTHTHTHTLSHPHSVRPHAQSSHAFPQAPVCSCSP